MLTVTMRNERLQPRGQIRCTDVEMVIRLNRPSTYVLTVSPEDLPKAARIKPGWGFILQEEQLVLSGPITGWSISKSDGLSERTYTGVSDLTALTDRVTYPDPASPASAQTVAYYKRSGAAETIIKNMVEENAGPRALPARQTYGLEVTPTQGQGNRVTVNTRLKNLLDETAALAKGAGLVMDCAQSANAAAVLFDVRPIRDRSRRVRLTARADEVLEYEITRSAPTGTAIIIGGQGQGSDRQLEEHAATQSWGTRRIEIFKDRRDTDNLDDLATSARETLDEQGQEIKLALTAQDSPARTFGRDYQVGDTITVELEDGIIYTEQLTSARVKWADGYREVKLTLGNTDEDTVTSTEAKKIAKIAQQIAGLETI